MAGSNINISENSPTFPTQLDGGELVSAVLRYDPRTIDDNAQVHTHQIDFATFQLWDSIIGQQSAEAAIATFEANGEIVIAYATYVSTVFEITVPNEICLGDWCWTPPGAGHIIESSKMWRFWFLTATPGQASPLVAQSAPQAAAAVPAIGAGALIVLVVGAIAGVVIVIGAIQVIQGEITWNQLKAGVLEIFKVPGQNVSAPVTAASWPFFAMGIALVAGAMFLPSMTTNANISVPIGGARVAVGGTTASSGKKR
jgi:hypothetical protein